HPHVPACREKALRCLEIQSGSRKRIRPVGWKRDEALDRSEIDLFAWQQRPRTTAQTRFRRWNEQSWPVERSVGSARAMRLQHEFQGFPGSGQTVVLTRRVVRCAGPTRRRNRLERRVCDGHTGGPRVAGLPRERNGPQSAGRWIVAATDVTVHAGKPHL